MQFSARLRPIVMLVLGIALVLGVATAAAPSALALTTGPGSTATTYNPAAMPLNGGATTPEREFVKFFKEYGTTTYEGSDQYIVDQGYLICEGWANGATTQIIYRTMLAQGWTENEADMMIYGAHNFLCWNVQAH